MKKSEISRLSSHSRYLQELALNFTTVISFSLLTGTGSTSMSNVASQKSSDVGSQKCCNVGSQNNSNVGSQKSSNVGSQKNSNVGSQKSSTSSTGTMERYVSPPLSYSAVCQIPNSNSSPPNSNQILSKILINYLSKILVLLLRLLLLVLTLLVLWTLRCLALTILLMRLLSSLSMSSEPLRGFCLRPMLKELVLAVFLVI